MSAAAAHESKQVKKLCQKYRDHTLCFACYRSERDRIRAVRITEPRRTPPHGPFAQVQTLTPRQQTHRRLMLVHLQGLQPGDGSTRTA